MDFPLPWQGKSAPEVTNSLKQPKSISLMAALQPQTRASSLLGFTGTPGSPREHHIQGRGRDGGDMVSLLLNCMKRPDIALSGTASTSRYKRENKIQKGRPSAKEMEGSLTASPTRCFDGIIVQSWPNL